jgi:threonine/homoserine/homoserine lactone efflux protein
MKFKALISGAFKIASFNKILALLILTFSAFALSQTVNAFDLPFGSQEGLIDPSEIQDPDFSGTSDAGSQVLTGAMIKIVDTFRLIIGSIAVLWLVYSGLRMVTAGADEDQTTKAKKGVTWSIISLALILISKPMILNVFYGGGSITAGEALADRESIQQSISAGSRIILAVLGWVKTIMVTVAMFYLIFSGWKMIQAFGNQEEVSSQKTVLTWIGVGLILFSINEVLINEVLYNVAFNNLDLGEEGVSAESLKVVFKQDPARGIREVVGIIKFLLRLIAIIAFVVLVYGGGRFIFAFGDEEQVNSGKTAMKGAIIGIIVILISYSLVATLISGET